MKARRHQVGLLPDAALQPAVHRACLVSLGLTCWWLEPRLALVLSGAQPLSRRPGSGWVLLLLRQLLALGQLLALKMAQWFELSGALPLPQQQGSGWVLQRVVQPLALKQLMRTA